MFKYKVNLSSNVSFGLNNEVEKEEGKREKRQGEWEREREGIGEEGREGESKKEKFKKTDFAEYG